MPMAQQARRKTASKTGRKSAHKTARRKTAHRKSAHGKTGRKWSARVTETSDAMTLQDKVFTKSPAAIARSIKHSAEKSHRRKSNPYRSAMSMLTFYINRAGKNLSAAKRKKLEQAKDELRKVFDKKPAAKG
jgi:hypothetical protein